MLEKPSTFSGVAKELVKAGANPNTFLHSSGLTPLHSACFRVKKILKDKNIQGEQDTRIENINFSQGSDQLVRLLLENGANPEAMAM